jgi:hypothetical protein
VDWEGLIRGWFVRELVDLGRRDRESGLDASDERWELLSHRLPCKIDRYSLSDMLEET